MKDSDSVNMSTGDTRLVHSLNMHFSFGKKLLLLLTYIWKNFYQLKVFSHTQARVKTDCQRKFLFFAFKLEAENLLSIYASICTDAR